MRSMVAVLALALACVSASGELVSVPFVRSDTPFSTTDWGGPYGQGMLPESLLAELDAPEVKVVARLGVGVDTQVSLRLVSMTPYNAVVHEILAEGVVYVDSATTIPVIETEWTQLPVVLTDEHIGYQLKNSAGLECRVWYLAVYLRNEDEAGGGSGSAGCVPGAGGAAGLALAVVALLAAQRARP